MCLKSPYNDTYQGRRKRGGRGGAGGARASPPPPLFGIEKKKKGEGGERRGKESVHPVPDRDVYIVFKKISPSNCTKMYKTPELPGAPPPGPHPL